MPVEDKKKLLILGGLTDFSYIVQAAKEKGIFTIVTDYLPDAPAKKIADKAYNADLLKMDELYQVMDRERPDGVVTGFADLMIPPAVHLTEKYNLPKTIGTEQVLALTNKRRMKEKFEQAGLACAPYRILHSPSDISKTAELRYPLVIKPVDSYGSKGVFFVQNQTELADCFALCAEHSSDESVVAEEYYPSDEIVVLSWVHKGCSKVLYIGDKELRGNRELRVGKPRRLVYPSRHSYRYEEELIRAMQALTDVFNVVEGPLYLQAFVGADGIYLNEVMARFPGGNDFRFLKHFSGLDVLGLLVDYAVGNPIDTEALEKHDHRLGRVQCVLQLYAIGGGCVAAMEGVDAVKAMPQVTDCEFYVRPGDSVMDTGDLRQTVGRVFFSAQNMYEADSLTQDITQKLQLLDADGQALLL